MQDYQEAMVKSLIAVAWADGPGQHREIGRQVAESFQVMGQSMDEAEKSALAALHRVRIASPESVMERYPHQLSGGMLQRVVIAMALACEPRLLIADEPTGNLDSTTGAHIIELIFDLNSAQGTTLVLVTHEARLAQRCARQITLEAGRQIENAVLGSQAVESDKNNTNNTKAEA